MTCHHLSSSVGAPLYVGALIALIGCAPVVPKVDGEVLDTGGASADGGGDDGQADGADGADGNDGSDGADGADDGSGPVDEDGDGVLSDTDCDDSDPSSYPGAPEGLGDGVDNDCDGYIDEVELCDGAFGDVQAAVDAAPEGGVVLICPGDWPGSVDLGGRDIGLVGIEGSASTRLIGDGTGPVVRVGGGGAARLTGLSLVGGGGEQGAGLTCLRGSVVASDLALLGGVASGNGGGLFAERCTVDLTGLLAEGNSAAGYGGGAYFDNSTGVIRDSTLRGNTALEGGGAFIMRGNIDLEGNLFEANSATGASEAVFGPGGGGGGLWTANSARVVGNTIRGNSSNYNGGGGVFYGGSSLVENNVVEGNFGGEDGGGLYFNQTGGRIVGNTVTGNEAADDGGGLRFYIGSTSIENNVLRSNIAGDDGGGVKASHSTHSFTGNVLEDNQAGDAGGGLELDNDSSSVSNSEFRRNRAYRGAGLHNWRTERRFTISDSIFEENVASDCGGGLSFDNSPYIISLYRLELRDNQAGDGAGICADLIYRAPEDVGGVEGYFERSELDLRSVLFVGNVASDEGGAIYAKAADITARNLTMHENSGLGAVAVKGADLDLLDSIISGQAGPALYTVDIAEASTALSVRYVDIFDNAEVVGGTAADPVGSAGNISADPLYNASYGLRSGSPCIDAGASGARDRDGSRVDMGWTGGTESP